MLFTYIVSTSSENLSGWTLAWVRRFHELLPTTTSADWPMSRFYSKPTHGTAVKVVIEEHQILDDFVKMINKKWILARRMWFILILFKTRDWSATVSIFMQVKVNLMHTVYSLEEMMELKRTWSSKWSSSGVWALISPLLSHFTEGMHSAWDQCRKFQHFSRNNQTDGGDWRYRNTLQNPPTCLASPLWCWGLSDDLLDTGSQGFL